MVTCCVQQCRKRANLDSDGYCPDHARSSTEDIVINCGKCNLAVSDDISAKALQCDSEQCKVWFHLSCTNISIELYNLMNESGKNEDDGLRWLCPNCRVKSVSLNKEASSKTNPICSKLKQGKCPHGITGKRLYQGKMCEYLHPKFCKKFTRHGSGGRLGCKKSHSECLFYHPTLCRNSIKYRKCLNLNCTFTHLKGTVRREYASSQLFPPLQTYNAHENQLQPSNAWHSRQSQGGRSQRKHFTNKITSQPNNFLDHQTLNPAPQSQISSLQVQMNNLEELVKQILKGPQFQCQSPFLINSSQLQNPNSVQQNQDLQYYPHPQK